MNHKKNSTFNEKSLFLQSLEYIKYCFPFCIDLRTVGIQIAGLIVAGFILTIFSTISSKIPTIQLLFRVVGYFFSSLPVIFAMTASTTLFIEEKCNGNHTTLKSVINITQQRLYTISISLLQALGAVVGIVIFLMICALFVKIPYLGEFLWPFVYIIYIVAACLTIALCIALLVGIHILPVTLILFPDKRDFLPNTFHLLKKIFPDWIYVFSLSSVAAAGLFGVYFIITEISMLLSKSLLADKFYSLISAIPLYPGYLLNPITNHFLPFDFVNQPHMTISTGAFIWALVLYFIFCTVLGICFNILNFVGATFLQAHKKVSSSQ